MAKSCPSRPPSGRLASSACVTSNRGYLVKHCYKRNIHYLAAESDSTSKRRRRSTDTMTPALRSSPRKERGDSVFMQPFWKKIRDKAAKLLGPGGITLVVDRAASHVSAFSKAEILKHLDRLVIQPPQNPDFNLLGASVFPSLERLCNASGAVTHAQIKDAVKAIWKQGTPREMEKAVRRVEKNMNASMSTEKAPGGKFYHE